jgi:hypothetical protein
MGGEYYDLYIAKILGTLFAHTPQHPARYLPSGSKEFDYYNTLII